MLTRPNIQFAGFAALMMKTREAALYILPSWTAKPLAPYSRYMISVVREAFWQCEQ